MEKMTKRLITIFPIIVVAVFASGLLTRLFNGKPITMQWILFHLLFVTIFMVVIFGGVFIVLYFFGDKIRKNPRPLLIFNVVIFFTLAVGGVVKMVAGYMNGLDFEWRTLVSALFFLGAGFNFLYLAKRSKRKK